VIQLTRDVTVTQRKTFFMTFFARIQTEQIKKYIKEVKIVVIFFLECWRATRQAQENNEQG
jgi:hypothetical protein